MKVTLRTKELADDRERLYLDIYNPNNLQTKRKKESLNLFIYRKPKTPLEKTHNKETLQLAEAIKAQRQIDLQNGQSGFSNKKDLQANFIDYFERLSNERRASIGNYGNWNSALKHLKNFFGNHLPFGAITEDQLEDFKKYLLKQVSKNSASSYFAKTKAAVNKAFDDKILNENPAKRIKGITAQLTNREFLTQEELQKLFKTECDPPVLKTAFLFSALTGLRWSDVIKLKWSEIQSDKSIGHYIRYQQKKTGKHESLPINETAFSLINNKDAEKDKLFPCLVYSAWTNLKLQKWVIKAGIKKDITFHCARHTYATLLLTNDVDIFTVSKLLGHSELKTTQIYTRVLDMKKIAAVDKLEKLNFLKFDDNE
jgi:integrase